MLHLDIIKVENSEEMGRVAADEFEAIIHAHPACVLGLATGSTPIPLYKELIAREKAGLIDFSRVRSANLDEYKGLAPDHEKSRGVRYSEGAGDFVCDADPSAGDQAGERDRLHYGRKAG